jgi:hypothetical protein
MKEYLDDLFNAHEIRQKVIIITGEEHYYRLSWRFLE